MKARHFAIVAILNAAMLSEFVLAACASQVKGRVVDGGKDAPDNGIPAASVTIELPDGSKRETSTAADGTYVVDDVPPGKAKVLLKKRGYVRNPTDVPIQVEPRDTAVPDIKLWQPDNTDTAYFAIAARGLIDRMREAENKQSAIVSEWVYLTAAKVPLQFKWRLARALSEQDASIEDLLPVVKGYKSLELETIEALQKVSIEAAAKNEDWAAQILDFAKKHEVPVGVCSDAMISVLYAAHLSPNKRKSLAEELLEIGDSSTRDLARPWTALPDIDWSVKDPLGQDQFKALFELYKVDF